MPKSNRLAVMCAVATAISVVAYVWISARSGVWIDPVSLTVHMTSVFDKVTLFAIALTLAAGSRLSLSARQAGAGRGTGYLLLSLSLLSVTLGIVGACPAWWDSRPGHYLYDGPEPVPFQAFAPQYLEMCVSLFLGFGAAWTLTQLRKR